MFCKYWIQTCYRKPCTAELSMWKCDLILVNTLEAFQLTGTAHWLTSVMPPPSSPKLHLRHQSLVPSLSPQMVSSPQRSCRSLVYLCVTSRQRIEIACVVVHLFLWKKYVGQQRFVYLLTLNRIFFSPLSLHSGYYYSAVTHFAHGLTGCGCLVGKSMYIYMDSQEDCEESS